MSKSLIILLFSMHVLRKNCLYCGLYTAYTQTKKWAIYSHSIFVAKRSIQHKKNCIYFYYIVYIVFEFLQFNHPLTMFTMCILQKNDKILRISVTIVILFANGIQNIFYIYFNDLAPFLYTHIQVHITVNGVNNNNNIDILL